VKRLTLMRHAKSSWKDPTLEDFDRPLNKRGKRDAPVMGDRLAERGFRPDRIVASPARRAWRTAEVVAERIGYPVEEIQADDRIYGIAAGGLLALVTELPDDLEHVMLFGHNPTFTNLANLLTDADIANVPTAGVVDIEFDVNSWSHVTPVVGRLLDFDYPKRPQ
jgi:phosphohistidine phosphatase